MQSLTQTCFPPEVPRSAIGFPFLAYQISRPETDMTFVDKNV